jgi:16S rRNA G966 N2-methylase RsmD
MSSLLPAGEGGRRPDALIYIEAESELDLAPLLPRDWTIIRSKITGQVGYHLLQAVSQCLPFARKDS